MMKLSQLRYSILLCFAALVFSSAESTCNKEEKAEADLLMGTWNWTKSFCCGRGNSVWTSPETCACTRALILNSDGSYQKLEDDKIKQEGKYLLRKGLNDYQFSTGDTNRVIVFDEEHAAYIRFENDTLMITRGYMDLESDYYVKAPTQTK